MQREPVVPIILTTRHPGTVYRVWFLLYVNQNRWFTPDEISRLLCIPLVSVHVALKKLRSYPEIRMEKMKPWRGRPKIKYRYSQIEPDFRG
jgi:predicted ArsR family transcriptional regulator